MFIGPFSTNEHLLAWLLFCISGPLIFVLLREEQKKQTQKNKHAKESFQIRKEERRAQKED